MSQAVLPRVEALSRGGLWLPTPLGAVQLGAPPDTLKDTLPRPHGVPRIILLPRHLVDVRRGIANADLEFPIYWNLFAQHRPLIVVGTADQCARIRQAVQESLLGPLEQHLDDDVAPGRPVPDLAREHRWFRRGDRYRDGLLTLDDAIDVRVIEDGGADVVVSDAGCTVAIRLQGEHFVVDIDGTTVAQLSRSPPSSTRATAMLSVDEQVEARTAALRFVPPRFGITVLGRSHGFDPDPQERTTGFVLWIGGRGVLVDPPLHASSLLVEGDIDADLVDGLILTHVHGDHDAGVLQKALAAGRTTLWTTPSIYASWLRKWTALSGIAEADLRGLFDFRPVRVGEPVDVHGAKLLFRFTLHSIPAIAFEAHYQGASFNYSGDTLNDPAAVDAIARAGFIDPARHEELLHFDWSHDLIFHESGIPPLHTPLERLDALDDDIKRRLRVLHVTPQRLTGHEGLILAEPGRAATIDLPVEIAPEQRLLRHLGLLGRSHHFAHLPLARAAELLTHARELHVPAGTLLIREGDVGDAIYLVTGGKAAVMRQQRTVKVHGLGDVLGETAVFLKRPRNADVVALTDLELLVVDGEVARRCCASTSVPLLVERQARVRDLDPWATVDAHSPFAGLTARQKDHLETLLVPFEIGTGHRLLFGDVVADRISLVIKGHAVLCDGEHDAADASAVFVGPGCIVGNPALVLASKPQREGAVANGAVVGCVLYRHDLEQFLEENPGVRVRIQPWTATEAVTTASGMALMVTEHVGLDDTAVSAVLAQAGRA